MGYMKDIEIEVQEAVAAFESASGARMTPDAKMSLTDQIMAKAIAQSAPAANLAERIRVRAIDLIRHPNVHGLAVEFEPRTGEGCVSIALVDNGDAEQRSAIRRFFDLQDEFEDEASLTMRFVSKSE